MKLRKAHEKIALEEHFLTPDFIKYSEQDFVNFDQKDAKDFMAKLLNFEGWRLEAMNKEGIDISVLSLTNPSVQRESAVLAIKI